MVRISRLRCEYLTDPVGIDAAAPRLSWELADASPARRGQRQTAYRIVVRRDSGPASLRGKAAWDSGTISSSATAHVAYAGKRLEPCATYRWQVRSWDERGKASAWSDEAFFTVGPLNWGDHSFPRWCWAGPKLTRTFDEEVGQPSPSLRKAFTVKGGVRRAVLFTSALGVYEARLNGSRVGNAVLAPEWTDYRQKVQYQGTVVTDMIRDGENVLGATVGPGWYAGHIGLANYFYGITRGFYGRLLRFAAYLLIEDESGAETVITTDASWKVTTEGPVRSSDIYVGETYDARREMPGWDAPGFDDSAWQAVKLNQGPALVAQPSEPIRVTQDIAPVAVTEPTPGTFIFDMGQNMVGWVRITLRGAPGAEVRLRHGEMLNADGTLYRDNLRLEKDNPLRGALQEDHYTCKGPGEEVFEPHFTYHGFRYVEVTGLPGGRTGVSIVGRVFHNDAPEAGTLECSEPVLNKVMSAIQWTQRSNMVGVPTDCPQRDERLGWAGDIMAFGPTAMLNRDMGGFLTKWLRDMVDGQARDGRLPDFAPHVIDPEARFTGSPAWADSVIVLPWYLYETYGDTRVLEENFEAGCRWVNFSLRENPDLIWRDAGRINPVYAGDWLNADTFKDIPDLPRTGGEVPKEIFATAVWARSAEILSRTAGVLGRKTEAAFYASIARRIRASFLKAFVGKDAKMKAETQAGYALALHWDLLPTSLRKRAAQRMVAALKPYKGAPSTGFISTVPLMRELVRWGYADEAYRLLNRRDMPSWIYMVEHGGTTVWERWDGWVEGRGFQDPSMNSFNHYAIGSVGEWMWRHIGGINLDPVSPGAGSVTISPLPGGGLSWARAAHHTIRGPVSASWKTEDGFLSLDVSIPPNMTATVVIPGATASDTTEGGVPVARAPGVKVLGKRPTGLAVSVGSGSYSFVTRPRGASRR